MASRKRRSSSSVRSPISASSSGGRGRAALRTSSLSRSRVVLPEPVPCASASDTAATSHKPGYTGPTGWSDESAFRSCTVGQGFPGGANCGSHRRQIHLHRSGPSRTVTAGERLSARSPQTGPDTRFVPGSQGVAGSNPTAPTGNRIFSNIFTPHKSYQKSQRSAPASQRIRSSSAGSTDPPARATTKPPSTNSPGHWTRPQRDPRTDLRADKGTTTCHEALPR